MKEEEFKEIENEEFFLGKPKVEEVKMDERINELFTQKKVMKVAMETATEIIGAEIKDLISIKYQSLEVALQPLNYLVCVYTHYDEPRISIFQTSLKCDFEDDSKEESKPSGKIEIINDEIVSISPTIDPQVLLIVADFLKKLKNKDLEEENDHGGFY